MEHKVFVQFKPSSPRAPGEAKTMKSVSPVVLNFGFNIPFNIATIYKLTARFPQDDHKKSSVKIPHAKVAKLAAAD